MLPALPSLLDRQMLFVTGKGGVGKTAVATALALACSRSGRRTIVCELAGQARVPDLLGFSAGEGGAETRVSDTLSHTTIVSYKVLEEWIANILRSKSLTSLLTRSNFFRAFAEAAPGGMELGTIVKTWELAQEQRWDKRRKGYDVVIVDGPASGHAVGLLRTPGTFADIARVGPIASQSERVREWLGDPRRTGYVGVALPGELPVSETIDLGGRLSKALGRTLERVVVNGVLPDRFSEEEIATIDAAAEDGVAAAIRAADTRADSQHEQILRLDGAIDVPITELPFVFTSALRREHLEEMADRLGPMLG
jgi:anion-transporting  ArsA/GET3 family ATPase